MKDVKIVKVVKNSLVLKPEISMDVLHVLHGIFMSSR
jgi:hypothetical protein